MMMIEIAIGNASVTVEGETSELSTLVVSLVDQNTVRVDTVGQLHEANLQQAAGWVPWGWTRMR